MSKKIYNTTKLIRDRETGFKPQVGNTTTFLKGIYYAFGPRTSWDHNAGLQSAAPGGIYNLEFSPDGSLLVAACEKKSILMFDPLSRKLLHSVDNAHLDCVNCVRFLDSRVFATCSDDSTVALWDARNLKSRIRTLHGHSNWVKNIEFSQKDGLLVTSGFDGAIFTWDINSYTESGFLYNRVFHTNGLMRTRLNADATKMIICTTGGYLILIHNLDLRKLPGDLSGFKPNMYRLMQLSQTTIPVAANFTHLFSKKRKKNRIEFLTDFPDGNDAEVVSSLQVHPHGWCALSRNISNDENSEWTCVHDIQETEEAESEEEEPATVDESDTEADPAVQRSSDNLTELVIGVSARSGAMRSDGGVRAPRRVLRRQNAFIGFRARFPVEATIGEMTVSSADVWEALIAIREARARRLTSPRSLLNSDLEARMRIVRMESGIAELEGRGREPSFIDLTRGEEEGQPAEEGRVNRSYYIISRPPRLPPKTKIPKNHKIHQNIPRLTHYIRETNVGKGFIKELCFSADGRLIFSPYGYGVRLLSFSPDCAELSTCIPNSGPVQLYEMGANVCHSDIVVSTKFSPHHCLLVSGCLSGRIVWHQPVL